MLRKGIWDENCLIELVIGHANLGHACALLEQMINLMNGGILQKVHTMLILFLFILQ